MYLRDFVIFPNISEHSLLIGRKDSINAIDLAVSKFNNEICIITQLESKNENPSDNEVFPVGTVCKILKHLKFSDGTRKILIKGQATFNLKNTLYENGIRLIEGEEYEWAQSDEQIEKITKEEIILSLKNYNPDWKSGEKKEFFNKYFKKVNSLDQFILKTSNLIASPYTGIQKNHGPEKMKGDLDHWEQLNSRIAKRIKLLTALPPSDKLNILREIILSETSL